MNTSLLNATRAVALSALSLSMSGSSYAATDQVAASFERMLNPAPAAAAVAGAAAAGKAEADPLLASVNAVLWAQPSYHLPVRLASLPARCT